MKNQDLLDYDTYKIIYSIYGELKMAFKEMHDENFDLYLNFENWQKFISEFYNKNRGLKYLYFMRSVLKDKNFCNNFNKIMNMELTDIVKESNRIKTFYRNSYILFLLQIKFS